MPEYQKKEIKYLKAINDINHAVGTTLELAEVCDLIIKKIQEITRCDSCAILFLDKDKIITSAEMNFSKNLKNTEFTQEIPAIKYIIENRKEIAEGDIKNTEFKSCLPAGCLMNSLICSPVIIDNMVKGIIHIDSREKNAFSQEDIQFTRIISREVSLALARSASYEKVRSLSIMDRLTGVFNRRKFDMNLDYELNKAIRYDRRVSLIMLDVDHLKKYNSYHGHDAGDKVLSRIAKILKGEARITDSIYRYGGEEFTVICCETDQQGAFKLAERLCSRIRINKFTGEAESQPGEKLTISAGCSTFPETAGSTDELINNSVKAIYKAKKNGGDRAESYTKDL